MSSIVKCSQVPLRHSHAPFQEQVPIVEAGLCQPLVLASKCVFIETHEDDCELVTRIGQSSVGSGVNSRSKRATQASLASQKGASNKSTASARSGRTDL